MCASLEWNASCILKIYKGLLFSVVLIKAPLKKAEQLQVTARETLTVLT